MFKQLTNIRPEASKDAELMTTTTSGTMRINSAASKATGLNTSDYASIVEDDDANSPYFGQYLVKGYGPKKDTNGKVIETAFGSRLASAKGKSAGSLGFSSESAYNALNGNEKTKIVYSIGEGIKHDSFETPLYKLVKVREEVKSERKESTKTTKVAKDLPNSPNA